MKKITFLVAALCATMVTFAESETFTWVNGGGTALSGEKEDSGFEYSTDHFTLTQKKATSNTAVANTYDQMRLYVGHTLTIAGKEANIVITDIAVTLPTGNDKKGNLTDVAFNVEATVSDDGLSAIFTGNNDFIVLTMNKQVRVMSITIGYKTIVPKDATSISIEEGTEGQLECYKQRQLHAVLEPADATNKVKWTSSNPEIATISESGLVTAISHENGGKVTITASVGVEGVADATYALTITEPTILTATAAAEIAGKVSNDNELAENGKYIVEAFVTKVETFDYDETIFTLGLADEKNGTAILGAYKATGEKPAVGDKVRVIGDLTKYKENKQFAAGAIVKILSTTAIEKVEIDNSVYARDGRIYAEEGARIFNLIGLDVTEMNGNLNGVFVVRNGNKVAKVLVTK